MSSWAAGKFWASCFEFVRVSGRPLLHCICADGAGQAGPSSGSCTEWLLSPCCTYRCQCATLPAGVRQCCGGALDHNQQRLQPAKSCCWRACAAWSCCAEHAIAITT